MTKAIKMYLCFFKYELKQIIYGQYLHKIIFIQYTASLQWPCLFPCDSDNWICCYEKFITARLHVYTYVTKYDVI